jgi:hypothetical protein
LDTDAFNGQYRFLDEMQEREKQTLKDCIGMWKMSGKKGQKER